MTVIPKERGADIGLISKTGSFSVSIYLNGLVKLYTNS